MAEEKSPQDQLAQVELLGHDDTKLVRAHPQDATRGGDDSAQIDALSGEETELPEELRRTVTGQDRLDRPATVLDDLGLTLQKDDQVVGLIALGKQDDPGVDIGLAPVPPEHGNLGRVRDR